MADISEPTHVDWNPYGNYYFALEIKFDQGSPEEVAHFMELSGLKNSSTVFEFEEGGLNARSHKRPGQSKWENIVLKYATSASTFMMEWRDKWLQGNFNERKKYSGSVVLKDNEGNVVRRFEFKNAWPVSWEGPSFTASGSDLAIETLELAHDGLTISSEQ